MKTSIARCLLAIGLLLVATANAKCNAAASANSGAKRDTTLRRMYTSPDDCAASTVGYRLTVISDR